MWPEPPLILAFDTAAAHCAAALVRGEAVLSRRDEVMLRGQAERLLPMLEEMLAENRLAWSDLDAIAVGTGPGNFTGLRVAVAAARGLAMGLGIPAIGVSRAEAAAGDAQADPDPLRIAAVAALRLDAPGPPPAPLYHRPPDATPAPEPVRLLGDDA